MSGEQVYNPFKLRLKSFLLIFISLAFSIGLVLFSTFEVHQTQAQSQFKIDSVSIEATSEAEATASGEEFLKQETVDYYMAYPGILPDHPLYWLKMLRDRILLFLTRDSVSRMEKLLLFSDKRLGAAKALIEGGKIELGITTLTKAEKYLEQTISQFQKLKQDGQINEEMGERLKRAVFKHQEILKGLETQVSDNSKDVIKKGIEKTDNLLGDLSKN